jgi:hypothetical protein
MGSSPKGCVKIHGDSGRKFVNGVEYLVKVMKEAGKSLK